MGAGSTVVLDHDCAGRLTSVDATRLDRYIRTGPHCIPTLACRARASFTRPRIATIAPPPAACSLPPLSSPAARQLKIDAQASLHRGLVVWLSPVTIRTRSLPSQLSEWRFERLSLMGSATAISRRTPLRRNKHHGLPLFFAVRRICGSALRRSAKVRLSERRYRAERVRFAVGITFDAFSVMDLKSFTSCNAIPFSLRSGQDSLPQADVRLPFSRLATICRSCDSLKPSTGITA